MKYLSFLKDRLSEYLAKYYQDYELFMFRYRDFGWCKPDQSFPPPTSFRAVESFLIDDIMTAEYLKNEMFQDPDYQFAHEYCSQKGLFHRIKLSKVRGAPIDPALITIMVSFRVLLLALWQEGVNQKNFLQRIQAINSIKKEAF